MVSGDENESMPTKLAQFCLKTIWFGLLSYITIALLLMVTIAPHIDYICKWMPSSSHTVLLFCAAILGLGIIVFLIQLKQPLGRILEDDAGFSRRIILLSVVLLVLQVGLAQAMGFRTGWDVGILTGDVWDVWGRSGYFSTYPNQLFIEGVFRRMIAVAELLGISNGYAVLVFGSCVSVTIATLLSAFCARRLGGVLAGYSTFFATAALWGLSPWVTIPYTDTYGMLWPVLVLYFYLCVDNSIAKVIGISASSYLGYAVKPTVIFVPLAILCIETCKLIVGHRKDEFPLRKTFTCALCAVVTLGICGGMISRIRNWGMTINPDKAYSFTHYLMMGVNERNGVWDANDIAISDSYETVEERKAGNIAEWRKRVRELGPKGLLVLFAKKTLCNYADGSFSWGAEGHFFSGTYGVCKPVQTFFGVHDIDSESIPYPFKESYHIVWLFVLLGVICNWLRKPVDPRLVVIAFALLLLSMFLLVFECRARYLYLYGPFFSTLSVLGWQCFAHRICMQRTKWAPNPDLG